MIKIIAILSSTNCLNKFLIVVDISCVIFFLIDIFDRGESD